MPQRTTITVIALLASLATLLFLVIPSPSDRYTMTEPTPTSADDLRLSVKLSTSSENKLRITISNQDPTTPRTFLQWDSPFDPRAPDMGIIRLIDVDSGKDIPSPGLKLNRMLPPSTEDLIEVPADGSVSKDINLKAPWLPADGRRVKVIVEGEWKVVWKTRKDGVAEDELNELSGESALRGAFRGEGVEITL